MAVARLRYLYSNCTLTFGSCHCRLLIFSGMKSVRFQLRAERKETDTPVRVESENNPQYYTVLWRLCLFSHVITFRQICALTPNISWLISSVLKLRWTHANSRLKSKEPIFIILFFSQCSLTGTNFPSHNPSHSNIILTTILDRIKWKSKPSHPLKVRECSQQPRSQVLSPTRSLPLSPL